MKEKIIMPSNIREYKNELNEQISKEIMSIRVPHTKATSETAMKIAERVGHVNKFDLHAACVLHDIAKELSYETMVKIIINAKNNPLLMEVIGDIDINEYESTKWLHGIVGAIVAHDIYGIKSKDVLKAIRYHKVGSFSDSLFTKILITSDIANELRQARYMISAYTMLKMHKYDMSQVYENIVKYDTYIAVAVEDVVIPRMLHGQTFKENKLNICKHINRLGDYYLNDAEFIWVPAPIDNKWVRTNIDGVYITPNGFNNAIDVMDNITHTKPTQTILTLSETNMNSYMLTFVKENECNKHLIVPFSDAVKSGVKIPRGFYPKSPTRYYTIDCGAFQ